MIERIAASFSERYRDEVAAESRGSADVAKVTFDLMECLMPSAIFGTAQGGRHFNDISRAVAFATSTR